MTVTKTCGESTRSQRRVASRGPSLGFEKKKKLEKIVAKDRRAEVAKVEEVGAIRREP